MDINVTSAARKKQRAQDVPAAIYVITSSDIRQSGLMTLPEILRLAPGVQVAQVSAGRWAVSIRGFNRLYSNKLLVLMDGRSVYSRSFSGVLWDMQDVMASDIERVEIIRGPGGVAWGANAVNGVVNIITRHASETQGLALDAGVGTFARERVGVTVWRHRRQHRLSRVFAVVRTRRLLAGRTVALRGPLAFHGERSQGRLVARRQCSPGAGTVHDQSNEGWMADAAELHARRRAGDRRSVAQRRGQVVGRWTRTWAGGQLLQVQAYHTKTRTGRAGYPVL